MTERRFDKRSLMSVNLTIRSIQDSVRDFHGLFDLASESNEKGICRHVATSFFRKGAPAFACVGYPHNARIEDGVTRAECDLVVAVSRKEWLWVEAKQIWKGGKGDAAHWLWEGARNDVRKLSTLCPPEASHVAIMLLALDKTVRQGHSLQEDIEGRFTEMTGLANWRNAHQKLDQKGERRVSVWFWWRPTEAP